MTFGILGWKGQLPSKAKWYCREGRGKLFSRHSINILWTRILPKWGGMILIGSLYNFSSLSILLEWKDQGIRLHK